MQLLVVERARRGSRELERENRRNRGLRLSVR